MTLRILTSLLTLLLLTSGASLNAFFESHVKAQLISNSASVQAGNTIDVALHLEMEPGWHTYYKEPGESGFPTEIIWDLPDGWSAGDIQWPIPYKMLLQGEVMYGYEKEALHIVTLTPPEQLNGASVTLRAEAKWLECADICIPGSAELELSLPITKTTPTDNPEWAATFKDARTMLTGPGKPTILGTIDLDTQKHISGPEGDSDKSQTSSELTFGILLMAFGGGLILNLMPCVFPVIGIKILGFTNLAGEDSKKVTLHGLIFSLGVILSFALLAGILISLKSAGESAGWGFQMQEPLFVIAITFLFLLLALNMSGVFSVGDKLMSAGSSIAGKQNLNGTFFSGVLATAAATPCSAPLLGTALGATLGMSGFSTLIVFMAIAIGMSSPYLLLSAAPSTVKYLPKPGAWMETFKQFLAFPLYATVGYLIWILNGQLKSEQLLNLYFALTLVAMAAWIYGRWTQPIQKNSTKNKARAIALAVTLIAVWLATQKQDDIWEPWSPAYVEELRTDNRIVYIDFTARWCATCQINKRNVFSSDNVINTFKEMNVAALKADWTNRDPAITKALESYGRAAVPTNVVYLPGKADPILLPEILTPQIVLDALD